MHSLSNYLLIILCLFKSCLPAEIQKRETINPCTPSKEIKISFNPSSEILHGISSFSIYGNVIELASDTEASITFLMSGSEKSISISESSINIPFLSVSILCHEKGLLIFPVLPPTLGVIGIDADGRSCNNAYCFGKNKYPSKLSLFISDSPGRIVSLHRFAFERISDRSVSLPSLLENEVLLSVEIYNRSSQISCAPVSRDIGGLNKLTISPSSKNTDQSHLYFTPSFTYARLNGPPVKIENVLVINDGYNYVEIGPDFVRVASPETHIDLDQENGKITVKRELFAAITGVVLAVDPEYELVQDLPNEYHPLIGDHICIGLSHDPEILYRIRRSILEIIEGTTALKDLPIGTIIVCVVIERHVIRVSQEATSESPDLPHVLLGKSRKTAPNALIAEDRADMQHIRRESDTAPANDQHKGACHFASAVTEEDNLDPTEIRRAPIATEWLPLVSMSRTTRSIRCEYNCRGAYFISLIAYGHLSTSYIEDGNSIGIDDGTNQIDVSSKSIIINTLNIKASIDDSAMIRVTESTTNRRNQNFVGFGVSLRSRKTYKLSNYLPAIHRNFICFGLSPDPSVLEKYQVHVLEMIFGHQSHLVLPKGSILFCVQIMKIIGLGCDGAKRPRKRAKVHDRSSSDIDLFPYSDEYAYTASPSSTVVETQINHEPGLRSR